MRAFKVYVGVLLFIITVLLAALVASLAYGAHKLQAVSGQVSNFNHKVDQVNQNLQHINTQLENQNSHLTTRGL